MPMTVVNQTGDGITVPLLDVQFQLPDTGTSLPLVGRVQRVGSPSQAITGSPLTIPAAPAAGSVFYNVQVDVTSGAASVQQSTSADPALINSNNVVVFRQTLGTTSTNPALTPESTPDSW
ncbi:MAG: hypothetical protein NVS3B26_16480 [Mycobacteriales bacterium]